MTDRELIKKIAEEDCFNPGGACPGAGLTAPCAKCMTKAAAEQMKTPESEHTISLRKERSNSPDH